ncbi:MAG: argininosuccinate synthase [Planctomycetes bacterium]|nr:argininosuccinate synthase [Planctomycetota bacterium]
MAAKVVLAFSGGLDTLIAIHWLRTVRNLRVVTFSAHLGQPDGMAPLGERAIALGASAAHVGDLRDTFLQEYAFRALRADAVYEGGYLLSSALTRPLIASELVRIAEEEGCEFVAHGCRGVGNDQIRFENCMRALAPDLTVLAPLRELKLQSTKDDVEYARTVGIPLTGIRREVLSIEQNLWGASIRLDPFLDPWGEAGRETHVMTTPPEEAPDKPAHVEIEFKKGIPVALDRKELPPIKLVDTLNKIAGRHAIGRLEMIENRISGVKSRELYEAPGAAALYAAHAALEEITLDKVSARVREILSREYARMVYDGLWFTPLRESVDSFFDRLQRDVNGTVRLKLYRGGMQISGRRGPRTLYRPDLLAHCGEEVFELAALPGGLPTPAPPPVTTEAADNPDSATADSSSALAPPTPPAPAPAHPAPAARTAAHGRRDRRHGE